MISTRGCLRWWPVGRGGGCAIVLLYASQRERENEEQEISNVESRMTEAVWIIRHSHSTFHVRYFLLGGPRWSTRLARFSRRRPPGVPVPDTSAGGCGWPARDRPARAILRPGRGFPARAGS